MWFLITAYSHRDRERAARAYTHTHTGIHTSARKHSKPDAALISVDAPPRCGVIHNEN